MLINSEELKNAKDLEGTPEIKSKTKWGFEICGYVLYGDNPPEKCPVCGVGLENFKKVD